MNAIALTLISTFAWSPSIGPDHLALGEVAKHEFKRPPLDALGVKSLADLRGKPVLVAYWGHTTWADAWVADLLVWQKEFGEDLQVLFVEMQSAGPVKIEAVALQKKWLGSRAMWTTEYAAYSGMRGLPQFSLLSNEGKLILNGASGVMGMSFIPRRLEEIEDAITEQARLRREGPDGTPDDVRGAYKLYAKGKLSEAFALARRLSEDGAPDVASAAAAAATELERRIDSRLVRAAALLEAGRLHEMQAEMDGLGRQLGAEKELLARFEELQESLASEAQKAEREASAALAKIERKLATKGFKSANVKALERFAKKHAGTKSAARAERMVELGGMRI
ncbi:MAG: hypothetical protein GY711_21805 [bacterium]|nr:hypothetical protein [bacterium]